MDEVLSCMAVRLPRFVIRQDVFLRLPIQNVDVVISQVDWFYPVTGVLTTTGMLPLFTLLEINDA